MLLILAVIIAIAWLMGFAVFHVAGGAFHLLLLVAAVVLVVHFLRAGRAGAA